jgi:osmotically-inducible protein OsmY
MKKQFIFTAAFILSAALAQSQTSSGGSSGNSGGSSGAASSSSGGTATSSGQSAQPSGFGTGAQPPQGANVNAGANAGAFRPQDATRERVFVNTQNRPGAGGTNQSTFGVNQPFGGTNEPRFGSTNGQVPFSTNVGPAAIAGTNSATVNEAAGATANPALGTPATPGTASQNAAADQLFAQRLQAALSRSGATQVYFPQTRSTIQVMNQNGTITLQGIVSSEAERQSIENRVRAMQGVTGINNQLQVAANPQALVPPLPQTPQPAPGSGRQLLNP